MHNIFRIQDDDSIMYRVYCIAFIENMLTGKTLLGYINLLSTNDYKENDKIILSTLETNMASLASRLKELRDCSWIRTHNHLVHKRTLNHLAKLGQFG